MLSVVGCYCYAECRYAECCDTITRNGKNRTLNKLYVSSQTKTLQAGSTITNGREPRSCLGRVSNCKLGSYTDNTKNVAACK
jgi:hypothetical protein